MGIEILLDPRLIHVVRLQFSVLHLIQEFTHRVHDLSAAAIAEGECEMEPVEMGGFLFSGSHPPAGGGREES